MLIMNGIDVMILTHDFWSSVLSYDVGQKREKKWMSHGCKIKLRVNLYIKGDIMVTCKLQLCRASGSKVFNVWA